MKFLTNSRARMAAIITASIIGGGLLTGTAMAYQVHMWNALHALQNADVQLQAALPDKGGHRDNAISLINQAIGEVNAGIAAGS